ncbi:MAG: hypothetical protein LBP41_02320 [Holosporaceae bacterium]|jgi:hypothetical protein|nr:hypothetical protein [Holosporaceae bacterium]
MTILRGIRSLSETYDRDFPNVADTDENISSVVIFETEEEVSFVKLANNWPDFIALEASMSPTTLAGTATMERIEIDKNLGKVSIYNAPPIDAQSHIANIASCCSKIAVNFENAGRYKLDGNVKNFYEKSFDDYELALSTDCIFEKIFLTCSDGTSLTEKYARNSRGGVLLEYGGEFARCRFYPYGGFFEYGAHPRQMESCVFRTVHDGKSIFLRISPVSMLKSIGVDPMEDKLEDGYSSLIGVKEFSSSQRTNLYDELKNGACRLKVINKNTSEECFYKSNAIFHVAKTNIITINFLRE